MVPEEEREKKRMKKYLSILLILIILSTTSCSNSEQGASDKAIACAKKAVATIESYLAYEITYDEASETISSLCNDMDYASDLPDDAPNHLDDFIISNTLVVLSHDLLMDHYDSTDESYAKLQEYIQELGEYIE